jgi:Na+/melibiose symporter-like transporter
MGFLLRWLAAFVLLVATYNPTELSYVRWVMRNGAGELPIAVFLGLILLVAYVLFLTALFRGIGTLGILLILAVTSALIWVLADLGWLSLDDPTVNTWLALVALSLVLAVGMYWGILWRRISGQLEVDDEGAA